MSRGSHLTFPPSRLQVERGFHLMPFSWAVYRGYTLFGQVTLDLTKRNTLSATNGTLTFPRRAALGMPLITPAQCRLLSRRISSGRPVAEFVCKLSGVNGFLAVRMASGTHAHPPNVSSRFCLCRSVSSGVGLSSLFSPVSPDCPSHFVLNGLNGMGAVVHLAQASSVCTSWLN